MYIRKPKLINIYIVCIFLLDYCLFFISELPETFSSYNNKYCKAIIAMLALIAAFVCFTNDQNYFADYRFAKEYSAFALFLTGSLIVHAFINYPDMSILSCLRGCDFLLLIFLVFPFLRAMDSEDSFNRILRNLNIVALIWYIVLIIQSFTYAANGTVFLTYFDGETIQTRNDSMRIALMSLGNAIIYYNFYQILKNGIRKHTIFNIIQFILGLYCFVYIQQTRALIFACFLSLAIMYLLHSESPLATFRNYVIVIVAFVALYYSGVLSQFIDSFTGSEVKNTLIRQEAIAYYLAYWTAHPLFGMGLSTNDNLIHGSYGTYYMSDVGIVGMLAKCGIFAVLLYLFIFIRWLRIIMRLRKYSAESKQDCILLVGLFIYFFAPIYSISFFYSAWSLTVPLVMSIFEYINHKYDEINLVDEEEHFCYYETK